MPANSWSAPANATSFCKITIKINENTPILTEQLKVDDLHTDCVKFEFIETILEWFPYEIGFRGIRSGDRLVQKLKLSEYLARTATVNVLSVDKMMLSLSAAMTTALRLSKEWVGWASEQ